MLLNGGGLLSKPPTLTDMEQIIEAAPGQMAGTSPPLSESGAEREFMTADVLALSQLRLEIVDLERQVRDESDELDQLNQELASAHIGLNAMEEECAELTAQLCQRQRVEARQANTAKLLQLQLTMATQLYGVAESLTHVAAGSTHSGCKQLADPQDLRSQEIYEMRRALKRQQNLVADAHRQLLELATRKRPLGVASKTPADVSALRAALAEQEMARAMADARADELCAQVRMLEEQGLRLRLHAPSILASPSFSCSQGP